MIYLDNAATTIHKPQQVYETLYEYSTKHGANALRGAYGESLKSSEVIVDAQNIIGALFNIKQVQNIVFTQNATYALNTAILGTLEKDDHAVITQMEHNSVVRPIHSLCSYTVVKADKDGFVSPYDIEKAITPKTKLIAVTHASNVCGTLQDIKSVSKIAHLHKVKLLIDAAQSAGAVEIDIEEINPDFLAFSGHKGLMGPMGTGGLYIKNPQELKAVICGGTGSDSQNVAQPETMPEKFHSGTLNTPALAALTEGVKYIMDTGVKEIGRYENEIAAFLKSELKNMKGVKVYGAKESVANVAFNIEGIDSGETAKLLNDFALRAGYHCAPFAHNALGTQDTGAVRASFGIFNTRDEARALADSVYKITRDRC